MKEKFGAERADLKEIDDRFGEDSWGVKKFVNPKKTGSDQPKTAPVARPEDSSNNSPQETKQKGKQFLDKNNMFSILPTN
jgi:hypothetical protein